MATARSYPAQEAGRQSAPVGGSQAIHGSVFAQAAGHTCPLLAQVPEIALPEPERTSTSPSAATSDPVYRFDRPELPQPHSSAESIASRRLAALPSGSRQGRDAEKLPDATGLPLWAKTLDAAGVKSNTHSKGASRKTTSAASVTRFLLLVALFTAAGLSIRMMNTARQQPTAPVDAPPPATGSAEHSTSSVPPVQPVSQAETFDGSTKSAPKTSEALLPGAISPATVAVDQFPSERGDDERSVTVTYPKVLRLSPKNADPLEADGDEAPETNASPAVAELPGYILEPPPHQAQHELEETHVH